jgi:TonB family protein
MLMLRKGLFLLLLLAAASSAFAADLKDALNQQYKKHILALRAPFVSGTGQKFDSSGNPLSQPGGKWLLYGGIYVEKISVSAKKLEVQGRRIGLGEDKKKEQLVIDMRKRVNIEIQLDQPLHSIDEAQVLLDRVFFPFNETPQHAKPELRRADFKPANETVYPAGKDGVSFPRATYTPEPDFSEQARRARYQGTVILNIVVDHAGAVARIRLERALGAGLDENAMESVKDWRFNPAMREGQPVAVEIKIEVSFSLY